MLPLSLIAGQSGRLNFSGGFSGALSAAIFRRGREALALQVSGGSVRIPPTLEPGLHLLEARAGGRTLLHRHAVCQTQRGVAGLTACSQQDYIPLYNHFAAVLGIRPLADHTPQDHLARAIWTLREALHRFELAEAYACAILRDRGAIGPDLDTLCHSAGPQTVRQVTYTIINRGRAKLRKQEQALNLPITEEPHTSPATLPPGKLAAHFNARLSTP